MSIPDILQNARVVPVVVIQDASNAVPLAQALVQAGLNIIEVTLRSEQALEAIRRIASDVPEMNVGAGSVRYSHQIAALQEAGAGFAVSPGSSQSLLDAANDAGLPLVPGVATATEVIALLEQGVMLQKFFPAGILGGVAALKALGSPLPEVKFFPTGGITIENAPEYLGLSNVHCIGGTWVAPEDLISAGDFVAISERARTAAQL